MHTDHVHRQINDGGGRDSEFQNLSYAEKKMYVFSFDMKKKPC